jgi:hypothetical protein
MPRERFQRGWEDPRRVAVGSAKKAVGRGVTMPTAERTPSIAELSIVSLRHSQECKGGVLPEGAKGAVVHAYRGGAGYEVEFEKPFHCVVTVRRDDIRPA